LRQARLQLEHRNFHHVDLALVFVHVSAQLDVMLYVILQSLEIDDIPGSSALVGGNVILSPPAFTVPDVFNHGSTMSWPFIPP
jgi:hypothetical protein